MSGRPISSPSVYSGLGPYQCLCKAAFLDRVLTSCSTPASDDTVTPGLFDVKGDRVNGVGHLNLAVYADQSDVVGVSTGRLIGDVSEQLVLDEFGTAVWSALPSRQTSEAHDWLSSRFPDQYSTE